MKRPPLRSIQEYVEFVRDQVFSKSPAARVEEWLIEWADLFERIAKLHPIVTASLIIARWEFLGALYLGSAKDTSHSEVRAYVERFLVPINDAYSQVHDLVDQASGSSGSDLYSMLRNKPLHGYVPAAIADTSSKGLVTWWIGGTGIEPEMHLRVDRYGGLHIDSVAMSRELIDSLKDFAEYLRQDCDPMAKGSPTELWTTALWAKYRPKNVQEKVWIQYSKD